MPELAALPARLAAALVLREQGRPPREIRSRTGLLLHQLRTLDADARVLLATFGVERLTQARRREAARAALDTLPAQARHILLRAGYRSGDEVRRATDAELLRLTGIGPGRLAAVRRHLPATERAADPAGDGPVAPESSFSPPHAPS